MCYGACELVAGLRTVTQRGMEECEQTRPSKQGPRPTKGSRGAKGRKRLGTSPGREASIHFVPPRGKANQQAGKHKFAGGREGKTVVWMEIFGARARVCVEWGTLDTRPRCHGDGMDNLPHDSSSTIILAAVDSPGSLSAFELWNYGPVQLVCPSSLARNTRCFVF